MTSVPQGTGRSLFIMLGDLSADRHTSKVLRKLRALAPDLHIWGVGGPSMIADGFEALYNCADFSVLEIVDQIKRLPFYGQMAQRLLREIEANRPSAVLLVDYGGFNLRFATTLRKKYPDLPIVYFISPQVWASRPWRVNTIAKTITKMLTIFPFEVPIYRKKGVDARHVGHPMLAVLPEPRSVQNKAAFCDSVGADISRVLVGVFPGSRNSEVDRFMPMIVGAIERLALERDDCDYVIAHANEKLREKIYGHLYQRKLITAEQHSALRGASGNTHLASIPAPSLREAPKQIGSNESPKQIGSNEAAKQNSVSLGPAAVAQRQRVPKGIVGRPIYERIHFVDGERNYELMANSDLVWAKSGTTSLEVATFGTPMIAFYRADWPSFLIWLMFKRVKWVSMANLLTGRQLVPELIQLDCRTERLVRYTRDLLDVPALRREIQQGLSEVRSQLGLGDYSANCAEELLKIIGTPRLQADPTQAKV